MIKIKKKTIRYEFKKEIEITENFQKYVLYFQLKLPLYIGQSFDISYIYLRIFK